MKATSPHLWESLVSQLSTGARIEARKVLSIHDSLRESSYLVSKHVFSCADSSIFAKFTNKLTNSLTNSLTLSEILIFSATIG